LTCFFLGPQASLLFFALAFRLLSEPLALCGFAFESLRFFVADSILFEIHELSQIEENGGFVVVGHLDTYITLFRWLRTSATDASSSRTLPTGIAACQSNGFIEVLGMRMASSRFATPIRL
jgi:hypothetical protein